MFEPLDAAIVVALVRMVAFGISGLLAYFGYRLFFTVPQQTESGGRIETPGLTITLSRIGPGTFFAVCAAVDEVIWEMSNHRHRTGEALA